MYQARKRLAGSKRTQRTNRRIGSQIESLESRQMMFGDFDALVTVADLPDPADKLVPLDVPALHRVDDCIDFEDLAPAAVYGVGASFIADNTGLQAKITGEPFTWSGGGMTAAGDTRVDHSNLAGDVGQEMAVNNILLNFDFSGPVSGVRLRFGEYGGNLNLEINGDFQNFEDFQDVNGAVIGGTIVSIPVGGFGGDAGIMEISGTVNSLKLGGQELWIDHICASADEEVGFDYGDANLDGRFDSADLVQLFAAGEYDDGVPNNSGWTEGDFNGDGEFDSADLVLAMSNGNYSAAEVPAEPTTSGDDWAMTPHADRFDDLDMEDLLDSLGKDKAELQ